MLHDDSSALGGFRGLVQSFSIVGSRRPAAVHLWEEQPAAAAAALPPSVSEQTATLRSEAGQHHTLRIKLSNELGDEVAWSECRATLKRVEMTQVDQQTMLLPKKDMEQLRS